MINEYDKRKEELAMAFMLPIREWAAAKTRRKTDFAEEMLRMGNGQGPCRQQVGRWLGLDKEPPTLGNALMLEKAYRTLRERETQQTP